MLYPVVLVLSTCVGWSWAQYCTSCSCLNISPASYITVNDIVTSSPLYIQAVSPSSPFAKADSVCLNFRQYMPKELSLVETIITNSDMTTLPLVYFERDIKRSNFSGVGPTYPDYESTSSGTLAYLDIIVSKPCSTAFVFYRCVQAGMITCATSPTEANFFIASSKQKEDDSCIKNGLSTLKSAAGLPSHFELTNLPRKSNNPCLKQAGQSGQKQEGLLGLGILGGFL